MFKRNRFKLIDNNLVLYPDFGNIKGFTIVAILCALLCYGLYAIDAQKHHIGFNNIIYICVGTAIFLLIGFYTAFKKVIFNKESQTVSVSLFGINFTQINFSDILTVEERSGTLPSAYYIILRQNPIGTSVRLSTTFSHLQANDKNEFYYKCLPLINEYLTAVVTSEVNTQALNEIVKLHRFKQKETNVYRYFSFQKMIFSIICLAMSLFLFATISIVFHMPLSFSAVASGIFVIIAGLMFLLFALYNSSILYVDKQRKVIALKWLFGLIVQEFSFADIEKTLVGSTQLNGIAIYLKLIISTKKGDYVIDKSISSQQLSDVDKELKALLIGNVAE